MGTHKELATLLLLPHHPLRRLGSWRDSNHSGQSSIPLNADSLLRLPGYLAELLAG